MVSKVCIFKVKSQMGFPLDMLRYDSCWPAEPKDVSLMAQAMNRHYYFKKPGEEDNLEITLKSPYHPTDERWASFGWTVTEVKTEKHKWGS